MEHGGSSHSRLLRCPLRKTGRRASPPAPKQARRQTDRSGRRRACASHFIACARPQQAAPMLATPGVLAALVWDDRRRCEDCSNEQNACQTQSARTRLGVCSRRRCPGPLPHTFVLSPRSALCWLFLAFLIFAVDLHDLRCVLVHARRSPPCPTLSGTCSSLRLCLCPLLPALSFRSPSSVLPLPFLSHLLALTRLLFLLLLFPLSSFLFPLSPSPS